MSNEDKKHDDEFDKERFNPLQCGGCQALGSARDYIRILEIRVEKQKACIHDLTKLLEKQDVTIQKKEDYIEFLKEGVEICRKQVDNLQRQLKKKDSQIKILEGQKTDIEWEIDSGPDHAE